MAIPKIIHYCWFGDSQIPEKCLDYIYEWSRICSDYKVVCWNLDNYDYTKSKFTLEAYKKKQWAFLSDYARIDIINTYGGIYLDVDVQIIKSFDAFLSYNAFFGMETSFDRHLYVSTGVGFGAEKNNPILNELLLLYDYHFEVSGFCLIPCPIFQKKIFVQHGFKEKKKIQVLDTFVLFPPEYFSPLDCFGKLKTTKNTVSIHHYLGSWKTDPSSKESMLLKKCVYYFGEKTGEYVFQALKRIKRIGK